MARPHVLLLPFPCQGHLSPIFQFAKRLASKGLKSTLLITNFISNSIQTDASSSPSSSVGIEFISDGYDQGGFAAAESAEAYLRSFETVGSLAVAQLIRKQQSSECPITCLVYDPFLPWALDVAKGFGIHGATLFTQSCSVNRIYHYFHQGKLEASPSDPLDTVTIPGMPLLKHSDLPSFIYVVGSYPAYFDMVLNQYSNIEKADWVLVNTFLELEEEVVELMAKQFRLRTIGPTIPSMYLDKRIQDDTDYGLNLYKPDSRICMEWLNDKPVGSVVYVSFGSMAELGVDQMEELARGIVRSESCFLWVVRASEEKKLPANFKQDMSGKGLIVKWCPQLDVLAHKAIGCFVTHCGWNSVLEALSLGVPLVGMPQWTDQPTNAKFVEDVWEVGVKAGVDDKGIVSKEEVERCIRVIMEGERGVEIKNKAAMWKKLAKEAMDEGGSSDKDIDEFVSTLHSTKTDTAMVGVFGPKTSAKIQNH